MDKYFLLLFFLVYLLGSCATIKRAGLITFFISPFNVLSIYLLVFFCLPILFGSFYLPQYLLYLDSNLGSKLTNIMLLVLIAYLPASILNFLFLKKYRTNLNVKHKEIKRYKNGLEYYVLIYIIFLLVLLAYLFNSVGGRGAEFALAARNGNAFILIILYTVELLPGFYLVFSKKRNNLFVIFLIIFAMAITSILGARTLVVSLILTILLIMTVRIKIKFIHILGIFSIAVIFFIMSSSVRLMSGGYNELSSIDKVKNLSSYLGRNADQLSTTLFMVDEIEASQISYQYGATIVDAFYYFIPRALYPSKPKSFYPSRLLFPEVIENGLSSNTKHTINFGMIARPFLDFGYYGVFIFNIILFYLLSRIFVNIRYRLFYFKKSDQLVLLFIYSHIHQVYILGIWSHFISILIFNIFFIKLFSAGMVSFNNLLIASKNK